MIDWNKLDGTQWKSFEDLCYVISRKEFNQEGQFTNIDDSAGGDGVEFYLTLHNGKEWGWQAKFFHPDKTLNSSRKNQIKNSLKKAIEIHKNMEKWFLCTPHPFSPAGNKWFKEELIKEIPANKHIELVHWEEGFFHSELLNPEKIGILKYFFGEDEFDITFFKNNFEEVKQIVGKKYIPELHSSSEIEDSILENINFTRINDLIESCLIIIQEFKKMTFPLNEPELFKKYFPNDNWNDFIIKLNKSKSDIIKNVRTIQLKFKFLIDEYKNGNFYINIKDMKKFLQENFMIDYSFLYKILEFFDQENTLTFLEKLYSSYQFIINTFNGLLSSSIEIKSYAGGGKTQTSCHITEKFLLNEKPAILLLGKQFRTLRPLKSQILELLGVQHLQWDDFLKTLDTASKVYKTRIPIIIDGLNEAVVNGKLSTIWKDDLPGFLNLIGSFKGLFLVILYRPIYESYIYGEEKPVIEWSHSLSGLRSMGVQKYLDHYNLDIKIPSRLFEILNNPLFLRIFCETYGNPDEEISLDHQIFSELYTIEIFREFIKNENIDFNKSSNLSPNSQIFMGKIKLIAKLFWENLTRSITLSSFFNVIEGNDVVENWEISTSKRLLDKGLIFNRSVLDGDEQVFFTFDYFAGYIIAAWLIEEFEKLLTKKKLPKKILKNLLNHPLSEDITYFLSMFLITKYESYLNEISKDGFDISYDLLALNSVPPSYLKDSMIDYVSTNFETILRDETLLSLLFFNLFTPNHPFNIEFFTSNLSKLSLSERDLSWTEYIRKNFRDLEKFIIRFKEELNPLSLSNEEAEILYLKCKFISWILPTTIRNFRNEITEIIFNFGCKFPDNFFRLISDMQKINDPYITERLIATLYGVAMFLHNQVNSVNKKDYIIKWAKNVFEWIFKEETAYSTTHFFIRQHARFIVELGLLYDSSILSDNDLNLIRPPYTMGGIREWGELDLEDLGPFISGTYPFRMENFGKYILGDLIPPNSYGIRDDEDFQKVLKNLYWRMKNLGFTGEKFTNIDRIIKDLNFNYYSMQKMGKVDRYGKKYAWIAYFELAGYRIDLGLIKKWHEDRLSEYFIDPSFSFPPRKLDMEEVDLLKQESENAEDRLDILEKFADDNFLFRNSLLEKEGEWVLMNAIIYQSAEKGQGQIVYRIDGAIFTTVEDEISPEIVLKYIKENNFRFNPPNLGIVYAGEIPWNDLLPLDIIDEKILYLTFYYHLDELELGFDKETYVPSKDLCLSFDLKKNGRYFEFFESNGRIAIISCSIKTESNLKGLLIFIKKNLLKKYTENNSGIFFQRVKIVVNYLLDTAPTDLDLISNEHRTYKERIFLNFPFLGKRITF